MAVKIITPLENMDNSSDEDMLCTESGREDLIEQGKTCFVGRDGICDSPRLYLVTFAAVVHLGRPNQTWEYPTEFKIERWVDITVGIE